MVRSGIGLMSGKGVAMALGFAFWLLAARLFPSRDVGIAAAAIAGVMLVSQLGVFGIESAIVARYSEHENRRDHFFNTAFTLVAITAAIVAVLAALIAIGIDGDLSQVVEDGALFALYIGMSIVAAVGIVLDQASMVLRRGDHVMSRNATNGFLSIVPLLAMWLLDSTGTGGAAALFGSWVFGATAGLLVGAWQLYRLEPRYRYMPMLRSSLAVSLVRTGFPNHVLTLTERIPILVLPLVITELISPNATAYWYTAWMVAWATLVISRSMSFALFAETSQPGIDMAASTFKALRGSLLLGGGAALITIIAAPWILSLMGPDYVAAGTAPLRMLVLSFAPYSVIMIYVAVCRGTGRLREATIFGGLLAVVVVTATTIATDGGLTWVAVAWSISVLTFSVVAGLRLYAIVNAKPRELAPESHSP
jgi:O-antigen/teichoic acid export membrane protein